MTLPYRNLSNLAVTYIFLITTSHKHCCGYVVVGVIVAFTFKVCLVVIAVDNFVVVVVIVVVTTAAAASMNVLLMRLCCHAYCVMFWQLQWITELAKFSLSLFLRRSHKMELG